MKLNRVYLLIELSLLSLYFFIILFSITIQPINLILGFFFIFILPGYNLVSILKPEYKFSKKLGYMIVLSLALESVFMLFSYILLYNFASYPESTTRGVIFNPILLISTILFLNLILTFIKRRKNHKIKQNNYFKEINFFRNLKEIRRQINLKNIMIIFCFIFSLIFLCVSTIFSEVLNNDYSVNYEEYRSNFIFFTRVPLIFYIFLIISILCLTYIIFSVKNRYITLTCISIFLYCLWILPYLQIGNYFNHDSYNLLKYYEIYLDNGIMSYQGYHFVIYNFDSLRYSTSLFSVILLTSATATDINFVLWYLYPLFYIFLPFFFYSVLKKYSKKKKNNDIFLVILVIFMLFTPQFLKYGHAPGTGVFGLIIFLILVVEFFNLMQENKFNLRNSFIIVLLYFFLSLTHTEECIYFLILIILYSIYHFFFKIMKIKINPFQLFSSNSELKRESSMLIHITDGIIQENNLKKEFAKILILFSFLTLIFYFTLVFFGYFNTYLNTAIGSLSFLEFIFDQTLATRIIIPFFLRGGLVISTYFLRLIILGIILFFIILYLSFFEVYHLSFKLYNFALKIFKKIFYVIKKLISNKIIQIILFPFFFIIIILIDIYVLYTLEKVFIFTVIGLILSYSIIVLQLFFFIKGIVFYKIENDKQNFFLAAILASSVIMVVLVTAGNIWLAVYVLHTRFFVIFVFSNSIIIQDTYFKEYKKRKKIQLMFLIILILSLGVFYSLRTLSFG